MAAPAAARPGVVAPAAPGRYVVSRAHAADEPAIARLLHDAVFPGDVQIALERTPSPLAASTIEGDVHDLIVARDGSNARIEGVAARSVRDLYVNGEATRVGYLGQLRVDRSCRHLRALIEAGFGFCRDLHESGDAAFYLSSVAADNHAARRMLLHRHARTAPRFAPLDTLRTFAIPAAHRRRFAGVDIRRAGIRLETGSDAHIDAIVACLHRNLSRYQLAPRWTATDLRSDRTRDLAPADFVVALCDQRVVGCMARWDQRTFKQVVVRGYSKTLGRSRPIVNSIGRWFGVPPLPAPGAALQFAYLSHIAVDDDREVVFAALLDEQLRLARLSGLHYVATAFVPRHPFYSTARRLWRHRAYDSVLYVAAWPDPEPFIRSFDGRILQPEVAVL